MTTITLDIPINDETLSELEACASEREQTLLEYLTAYLDEQGVAARVSLSNPALNNPTNIERTEQI